jgi:2-dehydro-3-deoxyglucarate aldolase
LKIIVTSTPINNKVPLIGSWLNSGSTTVAELMARSGFDFVTIDMEHSPVSIELLADLLRALSSGSTKCKAFVRTVGHDYQDIKRYMDAGADGVIVPFVNDHVTAKKIVSAVKYPPQGSRGVGFARDNGYGMRIMQKLKDANEQSFICVQIEHTDGIRQLDKILDVSGVDAAFLGPYDLSASMGIAGNFTHPIFQEASSRFLQCCKAHNVIAGIHVVQPNPDEVIERLRQGYEMIAYSLDITFLTHSINEGLKQIKKGIDG